MRYYVFAPWGDVSGGPELLHQLCAALRDCGEMAYMYYYGRTAALDPTPEIYKRYGNPVATSLIDDASSVVVLPEVVFSLVSDMNLHQVRIIAWWLSVDNYFINPFNHMSEYDTLDPFGLAHNPNILNFAQSAYAMDFLYKRMGVDEAFYLGDYINDDIIEYALSYAETTPRQDICLYNPAKGLDNIRPIMERCRPDIRWIPIKGFSTIEIATLMCFSKVYIDFGIHPGMDRIPREAAVCRCNVITNRLGSAAFAEDVCIPDCYKIADMTDYDGVLAVLYNLMDCYDERVGEYDSYRQMILGQKADFVRDVSQMADIAQSRWGGVPQNS